MLRFLLLYALFMAPWPGSPAAYRAAFISTGGLVFGSLGSPHGVRFGPRDDGGAADTAISVRHRRADGSVSIKISSRQVAYLPTVVAVSLILATPIPWSRRGRALFWGFLLVNVFIAVRLTIMLTHAWSHELTEALPAQPAFWDQTVTAGVVLLATGQAVSYIVPMLIWILVTFRRGDWDMILEHTARRADFRTTPRSS